MDPQRQELLRHFIIFGKEYTKIKDKLRPLLTRNKLRHTWHVKCWAREKGLLSAEGPSLFGMFHLTRRHFYEHPNPRYRTEYIYEHANHMLKVICACLVELKVLIASHASHASASEPADAIDAIERIMLLLVDPGAYFGILKKKK